MTTHHCAALDCAAKIPRKMLMCKPHWYALPKPMRDAIWSNYQEGQENEGGPRLSASYVDNVRAAVAYLSEKDGKQPRLDL